MPTEYVSQGGATVAAEDSSPEALISQAGVTVAAEDSSPEVLVSQGGVTVVACVAPAAPTNLVATFDGERSVILHWSDNADDEHHYSVEVSDNGGPWVWLNESLPPNSTQYVHSGVQPSHSYTYRVWACAPFCGASSATAAITIPLPVQPYRVGARILGFLVVHRDYDGNKIAEFVGRGRRTPNPGGLRYAGYNKRLRTPGGWVIGFNAHDSRVFDIRPYHLIEFWLRDPFGGTEYQAFLDGLPDYYKDPLKPGWYRDFTGLVLTEPEINQSDDGTYTAVVRGRGLNEFLYSEYIDYEPGTSQAAKSGPAETVAKEYVDENIGPNAGTDAGGYSRVRAGLTVEADSGSGATWTGDKSRKLLGDVLQEIADTGPGDYMIVQTGNATFEFQWRSPYWGQDKTAGNGERAPVILSARLGNIEGLTSSVSYLKAVSGVIVYGQGTGSSRKAGTSYDTTLTAQTSWARKVVVRQQRSGVDQDALDAEAYAKLRENRPEIRIDGTVKLIASSRYNVHWGLGDLITVEDTLAGRQVDRKIVGVQVSLQAAGSGQTGGVVTVKPELEDFVDG